MPESTAHAISFTLSQSAGLRDGNKWGQSVLNIVGEENHAVCLSLSIAYIEQQPEQAGCLDSLVFFFFLVEVAKRTSYFLAH